MKTSRNRSLACLGFGFALTITFLKWQEAAWTQAREALATNYVSHSSALPIVFDPAALPYPGNSMIGHDQLASVARAARNMESMLIAAEAPVRSVFPSGLRDPDGRLGIYVVCALPLVAPDSTKGLSDSKAWMILSTMAVAKYGSPGLVSLDYVAFTDIKGMTEHWYYELSMNNARRIQNGIRSGSLSLEKAYDEIVRSWRRVSAKDDNGHSAGAISYHEPSQL